MFTFEEDHEGFTILRNGVSIFEISIPGLESPDAEQRGMVACMVDALNKESVG